MSDFTIYNEGQPVAHLNDADDDTDGIDPRFIEDTNHLYKMIIRGYIADAAFETILGGYFLPAERKSPIVIYVEMTDRDAITLASQYPDHIEVTRAPADWHI